MAVYQEKDKGTFRYTDFTGERKQTQKRGFKTKREATAWEHEMMLRKGNKLDMTFESFYEIYSEYKRQRVIDIVANENSFHSILEYLESLKWDGIPRIQHMLTHFFGAEDIGYTGEVMKMHMMGAIRRLYEPGAKYDIMLCLVGGQGTGKSTFFRYLAIKDE